MITPPSRTLRWGAALAATIALAVPLAGCQQPANDVQPLHPAASATPGSVPGSGSPAERFSACLQKHGVDAIANGNTVLIAAGTGNETSVGNAGAPAPSGQPPVSGDSKGAAKAPGDSSKVAAAKKACAVTVPDYTEPNLNER